MNDFVEKYSTVFKTAGAIAALAGAVTVLYSQLSTQDNVSDIKRETQMISASVNSLQEMILQVVIADHEKKIDRLEVVESLRNEQLAHINKRLNEAVK